MHDTSIFPTIVYIHIISLYHKIPVGQKLTYTKLTVPFNNKIPENYVMALEASDRLTESIGGVPVDVFQGLPSHSVTLCLTSWENHKKSVETSENKL